MQRMIAGAAAGLLLFTAGAASAAQVSVTVGPELQRHAKAYGADEVERLRADLQKAVSRALDHAGPKAPERVDLVLESATPNRPTFKQLGETPGLSMRSLGLGGAAVTGSAVGADGVIHPISYRWKETDLRQAVGSATWTDAHRTFDRLAHRLAKGETPNAGPFHADRGPAAFDSLRRYR